MSARHYKVRWQYGTYTSYFDVYADDGDEAIAKARAKTHRDGLRVLPMAYEAFEIVEGGERCPTTM